MARPVRLLGNQIAGGTRSQVHTSSHPVPTLIAGEGKLQGEMVYSEMADCGIVRGPTIGTCQPCFLLPGTSRPLLSTGVPHMGLGTPYQKAPAPRNCREKHV